MRQVFKDSQISNHTILDLEKCIARIPLRSIYFYRLRILTQHYRFHTYPLTVAYFLNSDNRNSRKIILIFLFIESSDEEDSAEEVFTSPRPSTSKANNEYQNVVLDKANTSLNGLKESSGRKNTDIETDFQAVFAAIAPQK